MAQDTYKYFMQVTSSVLADDIRKWQRDIQMAESRRLNDWGAMDILGVQETSEGVQPSPLSQERQYTLVEEWIQLALDMEIKQ
jgi:hypothetical protein